VLSRNIFISSNKSQKETDKEFVESVKESLGESVRPVEEEEEFKVEEEEEEIHLQEEDQNDEVEEEEKEDEIEFIEEKRRTVRNRKGKQDKFEFIKENIEKSYEHAVKLAEEYDIQIPKGRKGNAKKEAILHLVANAKYWKGELRAGKSPEFNGKNFKDSFFNAFE
jgi:hypothetical protein